MEIDFLEEEGLRKGLTEWSKWICREQARYILRICKEDIVFKGTGTPKP